MFNKSALWCADLTAHGTGNSLQRIGKKYTAYPSGRLEQNRPVEIVSMQYFWRKLMTKQWLT